jgi:hypothetical protein
LKDILIVVEAVVVEFFQVPAVDFETRGESADVTVLLKYGNWSALLCELISGSKTGEPGSDDYDSGLMWGVIHIR